MNNSKIPTPRNWSAFATVAKQRSRTHYNGTLYLKRYCEDLGVLPADVDDSHLQAARDHWKSSGERTPDTLTRSTVRYWNELCQTVTLPPLTPVATKRSCAAAAWAQLPSTLRAATATFVGPSGPTDPPTRERTNLHAAATILAAQGLCIDWPCDLLTQDALDAVVDAVKTSPKRKSILQTLAALAGDSGLGIEQDRAQAMIRSQGTGKGGADHASAVRVAKVAAVSREEVLVRLQANIELLGRLGFGERIQVGELVLTRKNLLPRAQDAMGAILILREGVALTKLSKHVFKERDGCQRLVGTGPKEGELKLSDASLELLQRLHGFIERHLNRPPISLFDTIKPDRKCGSKRRSDSVGKGIAVLLAEIGLALRVLDLRAWWLGNLVETAIDDAEDDDGAKRDIDVRHLSSAAGKTFSNNLMARQGPELDAEVAQWFADGELDGDEAEDGYHRGSELDEDGDQHGHDLVIGRRRMGTVGAETPAASEDADHG